MSLKHAKWQRIRNESEDDFRGPINSQKQIKRLYLANIGPIDTVEEFDAQRRNLGPKDGLAELSDVNMQPGASSESGHVEPQGDSQTNEHGKQPVLRPKM